MASSDRTYVGPGPGLIVQCQSIGTGPIPT